jgi:hypothetical protein
MNGGMHTRFALIAAAALVGAGMWVTAPSARQKSTAAPMVVYKSPT